MIREPVLTPVAIADLRPTQITVGMFEVANKRKHWRAKHPDDAAKFLGTHLVPVVIGPKEHPYVIDHHHLARALLEEKEEKVLITVVAKLDRLDQDAFWIFLDNRGWMHPFDEHGKRRSYDALPAGIADLLDDPFRSLAGALRRQGGFAKDTTPFSEFLWADYFRRRLERKWVEADFDRAIATALVLAKAQDADFLPGWCGPVKD
jgi:hypothetical protein